MRTVNIQLVRLGLYTFCRLGAFKKVATDDLQQISVTRVQHRTRIKAFQVHLSSLTVGLIQHVLLIHAKRSWFTGLCELFQLVGSGIGKVYVSDEDVSKGFLALRSQGPSNLAA
jgi:hypothetical protein